MPAVAEPFDFSGRSAWISGAGRGIGLAIARAFKACGASVVAFDVKPSPEIAEIASGFAEVDVADTGAVENACLRLMKAHRPSILVNNAGITRDAVVWKLAEKDWDAVMDVNLKGAFNLTRCVLPMMRNKGGAIVNVSSINGLRGKFGQSNYAASKAGLIGFSKSIAREAGKFGVRVNVVAPGMVETEMAANLPPEIRQRALDESLLGKLASAQDVADAVLFLASDRAKHITGQVLQVDGGQYL
ncbi:MAG: 3-oxoacyl-ACP reductase FabG [Planctomycetes bacterium]|nr:3-oxoacyl-ACP reductase FabG [Planctomycetota bacterium]